MEYVGRLRPRLLKPMQSSVSLLVLAAMNVNSTVTGITPPVRFIDQMAPYHSAKLYWSDAKDFYEKVKDSAIIKPVRERVNFVKFQLHNNPAFCASIISTLAFTHFVNSATVAGFYAAQKITETMPNINWNAVSLMVIGAMTLAGSVTEYYALKRENVSINTATNALNILFLRRNVALILTQLGGIPIFFVNPIEAVPAALAQQFGGWDMLLKMLAVHQVTNGVYDGILNLLIATGNQKYIIQAAEHVLSNWNKLKTKVKKGAKNNPVPSQNDTI